MITIKGPISIKAGEEVPKKLREVVFKTANATKTKKETNIKEKSEKPIYTKESLEKLSFNNLRRIGYKLKVKDRNREKLISEILKAQSCI